MGSRSIPILLLVLLLLVPASGVESLEIDVDTIVPEYILDDHIDLSGTTSVTQETWTEDGRAAFSGGNLHNVTVDTDSGDVVLKPELSFRLLNNGNPVLQGNMSGWDKFILDQVVVKYNGTYWMYYTAGNIMTANKYDLTAPYHIGLATSTDGLSWTKYPGNPVLSSRVDSYDYTNLANPFVYIENGTFHMYYSGNKGNYGSSMMQDINVCYASSTDGYNWTKYSSKPVLMNGAPNTAWNGNAVRSTSVIRGPDGKLWLYVGAKGTNQPSGLGGATSTDFKSWNYVANNALYTGDPNGWEDGHTLYNHLEQHNGTFRMWTHADQTTWHVGWIWSEDGRSWNDSGSAVISPTAGTIYANDVENPSVVDMGGRYRIYVTCMDANNVRTVGCLEATPSKLNGTYASAVKDLGGVADLGGVRVVTNVTSGAEATAYIRWSNDSANWSEWRELDGTWQVSGISARYVQYKIEFRAEVDWLRPRLEGFHLDYSLPLTTVEYSVDGGPWQEAVWNQTDWSANVSLHDGDYDVRVRVTDASDAIHTETVPVQVDLLPPTGGILIEDGRYAHNSTQVKIDVAANDTHGPIQMQLSRQPDFAGATWFDHLPSATYGLLGDPEGNVTIYLRLRDATGRISETYNDTIIIDTTPPEGLLLINEGAKYTNSSSVTLRWNATDITGVVAMMVSNDPDFEGALWEDPMHALSWDIGDVDGVHTVYLKIRDMVGWETLLTDDIILDRTPPAASLSIDQDAEYTTGRDVTLNITLYDEHPISFKLANAGDPWPDSWRSTGSPVDLPWSLAAGADGQRTVRMLVRDAAGNEFVASDDIVLDTTPPEGTLVINGGDQFTNALLVTVGLTASDATSGLDRMRISSTDDFGDAPWQSVKDSFTRVLASGDGQKAVFVQLRDVAGLVTTLDGSIILDTAPPTGAVSIKDVGEFATDPGVELVIDMQDDYGLHQMMVSSDSGFQDAVWVPFNGLHPWDLGDTDGEVTVYVMVTDLAGNTVTVSVTTYLDTTPPEFSAEIVDHTLTRTVDYSRSGSDAYGLDLLWTEVFDATGALVSGGSVTLDGATGFRDRVDTLDITEAMTPGSEELYGFTVEIGVTDLAGWSTSQTFDLTYIPLPPEGALSVEDGAEWTNDTTVDLGFVHTGGLSPTHFRAALSEAGLEDAEWLVWDMFGMNFDDDLGPGRYASVTLELPGGEKTVWGQLKGVFDVVSEPFSDAIKLDVQAPAVDIVSPTRGTTDGGSVKLDVSVSDDQDPVPVVEWRVNGGEWVAYSAGEKVDLKEGRNLVEVRATDAAGNEATAEHAVTYETGLSVSGSSWLILVVILVVAALVGVWYWRDRQAGEGTG